MQPLADNVKVRLDQPDPHGFSGGESTNKESGILVEMPKFSAWIGFHSFAFEKSFANGGDLSDVFRKYGELVGQRVYWESFQDSGRRFKEGEDEYVILKLTDIIGTSSPDVRVKTVTDVRRSGSFKA